MAAIFGPQTSANAEIVKSICETLEIPNLLSHFEMDHDGSLRDSINLHPDPQVLAEVCTHSSDRSI